MNRGKEPLVSLCERQFVLAAIKDGKRLDGRGVYDYRCLHINPSNDQPGSVEVTLGNTRVLANVSCNVTTPRPQRPTEGELFFNVELSPMASPGYEVGRPSPVATEAARMLERCVKESRAVDMESLCIIAGVKVWSIRVDVHVLDYCGNIIDCATIAAITALKHFRRPDVTVVGEEATIHLVTEREPVPLSVHHMPFCTSFALFADGDYLLVDPSLTEEAVMEGRLVVGMNIHREICVLSMAGGVAIHQDQLMRCTQIATVKCQEITEAVKKVLSPSINKSSTGNILHTGRGVEVMSEAGGGVERRGSSVEVIEEEEEDVVCLGEGTAEVGLGGRSQWIVEEKKGRVKDDDVIVIGEECDGDVVMVDKLSSGEEEEEDVVVLTECDIGGFTKPPPATVEQPRAKRGGRGGRGGGTAQTTQGRGRSGKKKQRRK